MFILCSKAILLSQLHCFGVLRHFSVSTALSRPDCVKLCMNADYDILDPVVVAAAKARKDKARQAAKEEREREEKFEALVDHARLSIVIILCITCLYSDQAVENVSVHKVSRSIYFIEIRSSPCRILSALLW